MSDRKRPKKYEITSEGRIHIYPSLDEAKPAGLLKRLVKLLRERFTIPRRHR